MKFSRTPFESKYNSRPTRNHGVSATTKILSSDTLLYVYVCSYLQKLYSHELEGICDRILVKFSAKFCSVTALNGNRAAKLSCAVLLCCCVILLYSIEFACTSNRYSEYKDVCSI